MPLDSNHSLHTWMKYYKHNPDRMPTEPDKHDLLGFPGVEAEHHKCYIRRLWLAAEDDRIPYPKFLDKNVQDLALRINQVVNALTKAEDKLGEELSGDAFLEKDAARILDDEGFGGRIWGPHPEAEARLQSNLPGTRPRWSVETDSGYKKNDEDSIRLNLRCWMAARIQAKTNAPYKERRCNMLKISKHIKWGLSSLEPRSRHRRPEQESSPDPCELASASSEAHQHVPEALVVNPEAGSTRSSKRARSDDSGSSFSFETFLHSDFEATFSQPTSREPKRLRRAVSSRGLQTEPRRLGFEALPTPGARMLTDVSTNVTIPGMRNVDNSDIHNGSLSSVYRIKQKLQIDLTRFLNKELDYTGILREVIPPTRHLYSISPHRKPYSDLEFEFRNFNRALDHWESLITRLTASAGATQSPLHDILEELAAQKTFEDRVALLHNCGPRSQIDFPLERWTISLALFFEGLLGDTYMPLPFAQLVVRLRAANRPLYEFGTVDGDSIRVEGAMR